MEPASVCERCLKPAGLCVCALIRPLASRHRVLILQHPQEPDKDLGSARLAHLALPNSELRIGLSWPNLKAALGRGASSLVLPSRWAALYLGSGIKAAESGPKAPAGPSSPRLRLVDKKGIPLSDEAGVLAQLEGIVVLDGTWSQAKALWWRNAWLLKLRRAILVPGRPSLYRELRKEPRRECLSTIESIALALEALGEDPATSGGLTALFRELLDRERARRRPRPRVS
jgi:DTW domain-containing protein YfiP